MEGGRVTTRREPDPDASGLPHPQPPQYDPAAAGPHAVETRIEELERRIARLEARIQRWGANGLAIADETDVFAGSGGNYGTGIRVARDDHAH